MMSNIPGHYLLAADVHKIFNAIRHDDNNSKIRRWLGAISIFVPNSMYVMDLSSVFSISLRILNLSTQASGDKIHI